MDHAMPADPCRASVIIPVFNSAATLRQAVESALAQTLREIEVLVVDDGSTDGSLAIARALAAQDHRVRVLALGRNRGKPHAMNRATAAAHGTWIAVLDADDWFAPERLDVLLRAGEAAAVELVADNQFFFDAGAGRIVRTAFPTDTGARALDRAGLAAGCDPYAEFDYGMLKPVMRADFVRRAGLRYRESARLSEDFFILVDFVAAGGRGLLLDRPLYHWRQAFGSLSRRWTETGGGRWRYDFRSALAGNTALRDELRRRGETTLAALLTTRGRALRRLAWMAEANRLRCEGHRTAALLRVLRHPSLWPEIVRRLGRRVLRWSARLRPGGVMVGLRRRHPIATR